MKIRHMLTAAAIVITGAAGWGVWNRWFTERADPSAEIYTVRGIDISAHNGNVDFQALRRQGVTFAYIKATEGTDFIDRRFVDNARGLLAGNIPAGAYHFFRFDTDGEMQAWNFIRAIEGRGFRLPPAVDLEEWGNDETIPTARVRTSLRAFMRVLSEEGYHPVIYTNKDGYNRFVRHHFDEYPLWICSFSDPPLPADAAADSIGWHIWQFSHRGTIDGIDGYVDLNTIHPASPLLKAIDSKTI